MTLSALLWQCNRRSGYASAWSIRTQVARSIALPSKFWLTTRNQLALFSSLASEDDTPSLYNSRFEVTSPYEPTGDQPEAIERLVEQVSRGDRFSILRGMTGTGMCRSMALMYDDSIFFTHQSLLCVHVSLSLSTGKTHVMAHTIARLGRPTLVLCHNKTLAAQLARELRACLSNNHVQLFVSYYNHYVPESYNEVNNKYTAKKSSVNDELDALRHLATRALVQHKDVVIVASVSCIYGMGMPKSYLKASLQWNVGETLFQSPGDIVEAMQATVYTPAGDDNDDLARGQFHLSQNLTGATLTLWPPSETFPMRVDFSMNNQGCYVISSIALGRIRGMKQVPETTIFPAKHHLLDSPDQFEEALTRIQDELVNRVRELKSEAKNFEADRLSQRVSQDLQLLRETGTCSGVENYSRHMALRGAGEAPDTLLDYFGSNDWLLLVDESHVTLPQLKAMYRGDRSRKERLVKHGFRLPSALDNRPLKEKEFWDRISQGIFVSATPSKQEMELIAGVNEPVDMIIRPTFVCDPEIHVRSPEGQLDNLRQEIKSRARKGERALAMTLTKRDAEDLADYLIEHGVSATYIHSGLNTHDRSKALKALQSGEIDCLVGVNLLREGLDLPQVSLVAVLNADSEGFLRSETALLQTIGRAARNIHGTAILYANRITGSMKKCIDATSCRRSLQLEYNAKHGKVMRSTAGSSVLSIFDLLKDQIEAENNGAKLYDSEPDATAASPSLKVASKSYNDVIVTDHIPSKPGIYFWKDEQGNILYIGKSKRLRSRVKSYFSANAKHTTRIQTMLSKATDIEFILTPSDRDALILENNLIKHHKPLYNVLLKDDESYPYICASIGDVFPQLTIAPRRHEGGLASKYRYFGPYPHYTEINKVLQAVEEKYDLRAKCFQARYGEFSKTDYQKLFRNVLSQVFEKEGLSGEGTLSELRSEYEEASNLFDSKYNRCRDVIAVANVDGNKSTYVVHVLQLREGLIAGQFTYTLELEGGLHSELDFGDAIQTVLERQHYPAGERTPPGQFSFFPDEILTPYLLPDRKALREVVRSSKNSLQPEWKRTTTISIRVVASKGPRYESDKRALQCALENALEAAISRLRDSVVESVPSTFVDGTAEKELSDLLSLDVAPKRIECFDISHTQGEGTVASRVVFLNGRPARNLYRRFNILSVDGVDDYASLEEVLERRFRHIWENDEGTLVDQNDPWAKPDLVVIDGGKGQLNSALKGMAKADVFPYVGSVIIEEEYTALIPLLQGRKLGRCTSVPIVSLAKNKEEVFTVNNSKPVNERPDSPAILLLRAIRDESHRFALKAHRKQRSKANGL